MKKSDNIRRKTWRMLAKNLIVLVALAVAAAVGVMSWFTNNTSATASDFSVTCQAPEGLEIAIVEPGGTPVEANWRTGTVSMTAADYSFLSTLTIAEITGNGSSFIKPPIVQNSSVAIVNTNAAASDWDSVKIQTTPNVEYISFDLWMRVHNNNKKVVLTTNTYFGPEDSTETFGNAVSGWSPNSVIGAARLALIDTNDSDARKLLWIPAPNLYYDGVDLHTNISDTSNTYGLKTKNASGEDVTINSYGTYNHGFYKANKQTETVTYSSDPVDVGDHVTAGTNKDYKLPYEVTVASFATPSADGLYYNKIRVNIWIEGEDTESRALQVGGEFLASLNLALRNNNT